jgi:CRISPR-associated protein Csd2
LTADERKSERPVERLQKKMASDFFDIRMFGAVLATGEKGDRLNAGQVRGPVQITFARSIDPVLATDIAITRQARTTDERMTTGTTEMGRKTLVPYGLYRAHGFFNPFLADKTGVSSEDLQSLWLALRELFTFDRSASRGTMAMRHAYVFTHENKLGNTQAHKLFDRVKIARRNEDEKSGGSDAETLTKSKTPPRSFDDYTVSVDWSPPPDGIEFVDLVAD